MKLLLVDNYDSFTYNLVQYLEELGANVTVVRNDELAMDSLDQYQGIILSPGPGLPKNAGQLMELIDRYHSRIPILGVCLGHQAISEYFGATLNNLNQVYHGIASELKKVDRTDALYMDIEGEIAVGRYHSWEAKKEDFPEELIPTAMTADDCIMSFRHKNLPVFGVQYHPESILTPQGKAILNNFLKVVKS